MKPKAVPRIPVEDRTDLLIPTDDWEVQPLGDLVMVRKCPGAGHAGNIAIPAKYEDGFWARWEVLAVGPGRVTTSGERVPLQVKVGDLVALQRSESVDVPGRTDVKLVPEQACIAIVRKKESLG